MKNWLPEVGDLLYWAEDNSLTRVTAVEPENGVIRAHFTGRVDHDSGWTYAFDIKAMRKYARIVKPNPNLLRKEIAQLKAKLENCSENFTRAWLPAQRGDY